MKHLFMCVLVLSAVACKKKDETKTEGPAKATEDKAMDKATDTKAAPAAAATTCPDGATKNEEFNFCIKLPAKFEELPKRRQEVAGVKNLTYADPAMPDDGFGIEVYTTADRFDNIASMAADSAKNPDNKNVQQADIAGGGKFVTYENAEKDIYTMSWAKGTKTHIVCRTRHNAAFPKPELDEVCKSLTVL